MPNTDKNEAIKRKTLEDVTVTLLTFLDWFFDSIRFWLRAIDGVNRFVGNK